MMMMNSASVTAALDRPIKATADDAILAKLATTQAGYYVDPFLDAFSQGSVGITDNRISSNNTIGGSGVRPGRRRIIQPIIKRGTHARVCVMDRAVATFMASAQNHPCQIVVLGAGKDTSYFRYRNGNIMGLEEPNEMSPSVVHWYEIDHDSVIHEKATLIQQSKILSAFCPQLRKRNHGYECQISKGESSSSSSYYLIGHDLRDSPTLLVEKMNLDSALPTLFLMECVSMYVPVQASKNLLQTISVCARNVSIVCYEPILGNSANDPFGRMMEKNLVQAGVASPESCLLQTRSLKDQLEKLVSCGFVRAVGCDMWSAYETILTNEQRKRANQAEFLDEYEEWVLIMQHYCFLSGLGGQSPRQRQTGDLTEVCGGDANGGRSLLGWVPGKCLEVDK
jgi:O-methyltransferase involved in polyketide biosynthesis